MIRLSSNHHFWLEFFIGECSLEHLRHQRVTRDAVRVEAAAGASRSAGVMHIRHSARRGWRAGRRSSRWQDRLLSCSPN